MPAPESSPSMLVGIGASAGGLEALKALLPALPSGSGLAFVIIVHLRPGQPSVMAEGLQPYCSMPVTQVTEDQEIEPNHIYVIPPGCNLSTIDTQRTVANQVYSIFSKMLVRSRVELAARLQAREA